MYEEINQPQKTKWYHGILFCAAVVLTVLTVLIAIQLLKYRFPRADAAIFDIAGIVLMALMVWATLSRRVSFYKYTLGEVCFSAEKYTGQRNVRTVQIPYEAIISLNAPDNDKYESYRCNPSEKDLLITYRQDGIDKSIIISPSDKLKAMLEDKMKGKEKCETQTK